MSVREFLKTPALALVLVASPALAQDSPLGAFADIAVRDVVGLTVLAGGGENVGEVESLVKSGDDVMAVLGVGGFLGFGEHDVAVPLAELQPAEGAVLLKTLDLQTLEEMPAYDGASEALPMDVTVAGTPIAVEEPAPAAEPLTPVPSE